MKLYGKLATATALCLTTLSSALAQSAPQATTPTTKILAVGTLREGASVTQAQAILPTEVAETVKLYLAGQIDQWYSLEDRPGVAFVLNMTDLEEARRVLEHLPLGQAHIMSFELTRLGPLNPLRKLLPPAAGRK